MSRARGLARAPPPTLLHALQQTERLLLPSLTGTVVDPSPSPTSSTESQNASPPSWSFRRSESRVLTTVRLFRRRFSQCFCCFCQQLLQFQKDNAEVGFGSGTAALGQSIERTRANIKWVAENKDNVLQWLKDQILPGP